MGDDEKQYDIVSRMGQVYFTGTAEQVLLNLMGQGVKFVDLDGKRLTVEAVRKDGYRR